MNVIYAVGFARGYVNVKRVKSFRLLMRRSALLWRHACRYREYETAYIALHTAMQYRELAKLAGGAS